MKKNVNKTKDDSANNNALVRPHNKTTILTTTAKNFAAVSRLSQDEECQVEFVNDIVSSAMGGSSLYHHSIRRIGLLRRQYRGGYRRVKVRSERGHTLNCLIMGIPVGADDGCSAKCVVRRCY